MAYLVSRVVLMNRTKRGPFRATSKASSAHRDEECFHRGELSNESSSASAVTVKSDLTLAKL